jgi:hypothetical protein
MSPKQQLEEYLASCPDIVGSPAEKAGRLNEDEETFFSNLSEFPTGSILFQFFFIIDMESGETQLGRRNNWYDGFFYK